MAEAVDERIAGFKERFEACVDSTAEQRRLMLEDLRFVTIAEEQWPPEIRALRQGQQKPCLTVNRTKQHVRQVTNAQRQNRVSATVSGVDDGADKDVAQTLQGLIRHIEYSSNAAVHYDNAGFYAAASGEGFVEVRPRYCDPSSFEQEIEIAGVPNPFQVYLDPNSTEPDGSDAKYSFKTTDLSREEFEKLFPDSDTASLEDWRGAGDGAKGWLSDETIRVVEHYYQETQSDELLEIQRVELEPTTGRPAMATRTIFKSQLRDGKLPPNVTVVRQRDVEVPVIKWCKFTALEILEETTLPGSGKWQPLVRFVGEEFNVDGKRVTQGLVRDAKDPARRFNYMVSAEATVIGMAPSAPWVMVEGQEEGHPEWDQAHLKLFGKLLYKNVSLNGTPAPPPQRQTYEPPIQAISQSMAQAVEDLKATTGIYDASLGNRSNETSGRAIQSRQQQGDTANFHFVENTTRAIGQVCRIIVDWAPHIYSEERVIRIIGDDDSHSTKRINVENPEQGQNPLRLDTGKYDVVCDAEPSFKTKRAQNAEGMQNLVQAYPPIMQIAGDLVAKSMDFPYASELAERLKKTIPQELQDQPDGQPNIPPEVQQKLAQSQAQMQAMAQELQALHQERESKQRELDVRIEVARIQQETQLAVAQVKADASAAEKTLQAELNNIHALLTDMRGHVLGEAAADNQVERQPEPQATA